MANIEKIRLSGVSYNLADGSTRTELNNKEDLSNKVTTLSSASTDIEYPTAKATYDAIEENKTTVVVESQILKFSNLKETTNYFYFSANTAGSTISMSAHNTAPELTLYYSTDTVTWSTFVVGTTVITLSSAGDTIYFKGDNDGFASGGSNYNYFVITGSVNVGGDITTLLEESGKVSDLSTYDTYTLYSLFQNCTSLISATNLVLPSTTLNERCYQQMFMGCSQLTGAPSLPATTLALACYYAMFYGCTSLTNVPTLSVTSLTSYCYAYMFYGCTALVTAPTLPASSLVLRCYESMFNGCSNLASLTVSFTDWNTTDNATTLWMNGVPGTGTFNCPADLDVTSRSVNTVPDGWTIIQS